MTLWKSDQEVDFTGPVRDFTQSLQVDYRLYPYDIQGSKVWAEALAQAGALTYTECETIQDELDQIKQELDSGSFQLDPELEDIHMNIEQALIDRLGSTGAKIHYGRSRNDQVILDVKLYLKDVIEELRTSLGDLLTALHARAVEHKEDFVPGYTHLQPAQPLRLGHYLLAFFQPFRRDFERLMEARDRGDTLPLGSAALAGSGVSVDREFLARELGFDRITENSLDAVSDRDLLVELLQVFALIALHASRLCEDWIIWSHPAVGFCSFDERFTTGSSIMPQKSNPDVAELIRAHTGRILGSLHGLMTVLKAQPMSYNRDFQEDKIHLFQAVDSIQQWLPLLAEVVRSMTFHTDRMKDALKVGYLEATDLADYLVEKGVPFREAHRCVREVVLKAVEENVTLNELPLEAYLEVDGRFDPTIFKLMDPDRSTGRRDLPGGTGPTAVQQQLDRARSWLEERAFLTP